MLELRVRGKIPKSELAQKIGKILSPSDVNAVLTGPARVYKPDGSLLCVYLPQAISEDLAAHAYAILTTIRAETNNRGYASGSPRLPLYSGRNTYTREIMSSILGSMDPMGGRFPLCRTTAWTGQHAQQFAALFPYFQAVADLFRQHVPARYANQMNVVRRTHQDWVIPGTPFSTITVNNTYSTGVHVDDGDLNEGFSCLTVLRRGQYTGGILTFAEYRIGVDFQDRDVILMDAHEYHGNTDLIPQSEDAERISCVLYYRTNLQACGSMQEELHKAAGKVPL